MSKQFVISIVGMIVNPELWEKDKELYESEVEQYVKQAIGSMVPLEPVHGSSSIPALMDCTEVHIRYDSPNDTFGFPYDVKSSSILMEKG